MSNQNQHDPFAALRLRSYQLFLTGRVFSLMGYQMQNVAVGWELYERTNSALALGVVGLVQVLPSIVLTLPAGHVADRWDRKRTVLLTQLMLAVGSLGLAFLSYTQGSIYLIYTFLLLIGVAKAFNQPTTDAWLPQLIPMSVFPNAATWNSSAFQLASIVGPAIGGFAIAIQKSATGVYILDAISSLICLALTAIITGRQTVRIAETISFKTLAAGFNFVRQQPVILSSITLDLFAVLLGGAVTLLPIFARDILQVGPEGLGWLRAAPSIGAFIMALLFAYLPPLKQAGKTLLWSVAGFGVVIIIFGLSRSFWLSLLMLGLSGALDNISVIIRHTLVQIKTPDYLRGRVSAINSVFISTSNELGGFESGFVAVLFGPVFSVVSGGIGTIIVVLVVSWIFPQLRQLKSLQEESEQVKSGSW